jgi:hypothetical protein
VFSSGVDPQGDGFSGSFQVLSSEFDPQGDGFSGSFQVFSSEVDPHAGFTVDDGATGGTLVRVAFDTGRLLDLAPQKLYQPVAFGAAS